MKYTLHLYDPRTNEDKSGHIESPTLDIKKFAETANKSGLELKSIMIENKIVWEKSKEIGKNIKLKKHDHANKKSDKRKLLIISSIVFVLIVVIIMIVIFYPNSKKLEIDTYDKTSIKLQNEFGEYSIKVNCDLGTNNGIKEINANFVGNNDNSEDGMALGILDLQISIQGEEKIKYSEISVYLDSPVLITKEKPFIFKILNSFYNRSGEYIIDGHVTIPFKTTDALVAFLEIGGTVRLISKDLNIKHVIKDEVTRAILSKIVDSVKQSEDGNYYKLLLRK